MAEFSLYNWQAHPDKVSDLLEKSHREVSKAWVEADRGNKTQANITTQKAKAAMASLGGGKGAPAAQPKTTDNSALAERYRAAGWSNEDINEILN